MASEPALYIAGAPRLLPRAALAGWALFRESLRRHRALTALILSYALACYAVGWIMGGGAVVDIRLYAVEFGLTIAVFAAVVVLASVIQVAFAERGGTPFRDALGRDLAAIAVPTDRLANFLVPALLGPLFFTSFGSFKRLIPFVAPFDWDRRFMEWDRWLHGGVDPWALLQPLFGTPAMTTAISAVYNAWFFVMFGTFLWQALSLKRPALRRQFLLCFVLYWAVIGTALAMLLSSAGPCYFGRVTGLADPFAPLFSYLRAAAEHSPNWSLMTQDLLWQNHVTLGRMPGSGISAMPSMHVAIAVLLALFGWRVNRWAGIGYTTFALVIMVGSVHLGWHYAIDGYAAAVAGGAIWWGTGWAIRNAGSANSDSRFRQEQEHR
jgi:hypothetical protein